MVQQARLIAIQATAGRRRLPRRDTQEPLWQDTKEDAAGHGGKGDAGGKALIWPSTMGRLIVVLPTYPDLIMRFNFDYHHHRHYYY